MGFVETEGLVLRKYNLGDADRIVVVLTEKQGLIRGVANGAKRLKSKFSSSLEFFSRINLTYIQKEEQDLVYIRNTDLIESVFSKLSDPEFFDAFAEIADLLIKFTPPNEPNKRLYQMTRHSLAAAVTGENRIPGTRSYFEIWLHKLGGFLPTWDVCRACGRNFGESEASGLHIDFQLICSNCGTGTMVVPAGVRHLFLAAQKVSPVSFAEHCKDYEEDRHSLSLILDRLSDAVLERSPISKDELRRTA